MIYHRRRQSTPSRYLGVDCGVEGYTRSLLDPSPTRLLQNEYKSQVAIFRFFLIPTEKCQMSWFQIVVDHRRYTCPEWKRGSKCCYH